MPNPKERGTRPSRKEVIASAKKAQALLDALVAPVLGEKPTAFAATYRDGVGGVVYDGRIPDKDAVTEELLPGYYEFYRTNGGDPKAAKKIVINLRKRFDGGTAEEQHQVFEVLQAATNGFDKSKKRKKK